MNEFLGLHRSDISGRVLEVGDANYTKRFGTGVTSSDVLDVDRFNRRATVIADLETGVGVPVDTYDCIVCTQTLMFVFDVRKAVEALHGALRDGGVLLGSVSGISQISEIDQARSGEYWRFTTDSVTRLLRERFRECDVEAFGNVFTALSFLHGLAAEELTPAELATHDPRYQLLIAFRALK